MKIKNLFLAAALTLALFLNIAFGATTIAPSMLNPTGSSSGQIIVSTGPSSAPGWATVPLSGLSSIAANTVVANATGSSAAPTAFAMPSCSANLNSLQWTTNTGFTCATPSSSGSGAIVLATSPTLTTPNLGTPSAVTLTNGTGLPVSTGLTGAGTGVVTALGQAVTGSGGIALATSPTLTTPNIVGITNASNAAGGSVGEFPAANTAGTSMTSTTATNCTAVSLTAGDWDVWGTVSFVPAAGTTVSNLLVGINTTSATLPASAQFEQQIQASFTTSAGQTLATPVVRVNISSSATAYLIGYASFGVSTMTCSGWIQARRVR